MKQEIKLQLQFVLLLLLTGFGFFGLIWIQNDTSRGFWADYRIVLLNWTLSFLFLCVIRILFIIFRARSYESVPRNSIKREVLTTATFAVLGLVSAFLSFQLLILELRNGINIWQVWLSFRPVFWAWQIGFNMLIWSRLLLILFMRAQKWN